MEYHHKNKQQRRKLVDKIVAWKDSDHPTSYPKRFHDIMTDAGIPTAEWPSRLIPLLTGKVLSPYINNIPRPAAEACSTLKDALLNAMGLSKECCMRKYRPLQRGIAKTRCSVECREYGEGQGKDCTTVAECIFTFNISKFLLLCSTGDAEYVRNKMPKSLLEAANIFEEHHFQSRYRCSDGQHEPHKEDRWDD